MRNSENGVIVTSARPWRLMIRGAGASASTLLTSASVMCSQESARTRSSAAWSRVSLTGDVGAGPASSRGGIVASSGWLHATDAKIVATIAIPHRLHRTAKQDPMLSVELIAASCWKRSHDLVER